MGMGEKGSLWDYMNTNHVYETFENCKALQNLKNLSFNKKIIIMNNTCFFTTLTKE